MVKFADRKVTTTDLWNMLTTICGKIYPDLKVVDGPRETSVVTKPHSVCCCSSCCHSKHRRYVELLEKIGTLTDFKYSTLSELELMLALEGK